MSTLRTPADYPATWTLEKLAERHADHVLALACHGQQPLPPDELRQHLVEVLATGARIEQDATAGRWAYAAQGAVAGLPLKVIAAALGADPHRVVDRVSKWADNQVRAGAMAPERHVEILRLIGGAR